MTADIIGSAAATVGQIIGGSAALALLWQAFCWLERHPLPKEDKSDGQS